MTTWPLPWRIAAALARESGLDWARWAYGNYYCDCDTDAMIVPGVEYIDGQAVVCPTCGLAWQVSCDTESDPYVLTDFDLGIPDPSDAEAYRADCARRGVEPGPMPALSWTGLDGLEWSFASYDGRVRFAHDAVYVAVWHSSDDAIEWLARPGYAALSIDVPREIVARISALATAAARAVEEVTRGR
jgi:hypothetical protein